MRRTWILLLACLLLLPLSACGNQPDAGSTAAWLEIAKLDAGETAEELYAAALHEGILVIYSTGARVYETRDAFIAAYPGLSAEVQIIRGVDILPMLGDEFQANGAICDVLICPDINATLSGSFAEQKILVKYVPPDMEESIYPEQNTEILNFMVEGAQLFYNSDAYDAPPVSNWWELTEPQFKGRLCMVDPLRSHTTNSLLCAMIEREEEMLAAYEALYGRPLTVPDGSSAGQEYWRMLLKNDVQFTSSSEEVIELVGMPARGDSLLGIMVSSKMRKANNGLAIAPVYDMTPCTGVMVANSVMIAGGAKNVNSAKLFIRFLLGESDGTGSGYAPFLDEGSWPVRSDVTGQASVALNDAGFWTLNRTYFIENNPWINDWWRDLREKYIEE